jgi:transcriptional regulator with XRE-family HTH domain
MDTNERTPAEAVAEEVRAVAARRRYSQVRVARVLGCSQAAVSRKFSGQVPFDVDELLRLAAEWAVPVTDFFPATLDGGRMRAFLSPDLGVSSLVAA